MLIDYLPEFLKSFREYKEIMNTEEIELERLKSKNDSITNEIIISNATTEGISRFEKILGIKNNTNLTLENRKFLVKNKFFNRAPFTVEWLRNKLENLCGQDNYTIDIDVTNKVLNVQIGYMFDEATEELRKDLRNIIPANIILDVNFWYIETANINTCMAMQQTEILTLKQVN